MKTPEEMAEEYLRYENESHYWAKHAFLAGYKAAQEQQEKEWGALVSKGRIAMQTLNDQFADISKVMPQWISVKDRLPEDASDVLIAWADGVSEACFCDDSWCRDGRRLLWVTHWMPLPEPPPENSK
jgi:hypothetical protein